MTTDPAFAAVFLHGWLMSTSMWDEQAAALASIGVRSLAVKQPGHGSPGAPAGFTMAAWAERLHGELDAGGVESALLVGHSMGGMLALEFYRRFPERVRALALVSTTDAAWDAERRAGFAQSSAAIATAWGPELAALVANVLISPAYLTAHPDWLPAWVETVRGYDRAGLVNLAAAISGRDDMTELTPRITVPTLVFHSPEDNAVPFAEGEAMAARIPGARLVAVPNCGHAPPLEQPAIVTDALTRFVQDLPAKP